MIIEKEIRDLYNDAYDYLYQHNLLVSFITDVVDGPDYEEYYLPIIVREHIELLDPSDKDDVKKWLLNEEDNDAIDVIRELTEKEGADSVISFYFSQHKKELGACYDVQVHDDYELSTYRLIGESKEDTLTFLAKIIIEQKVSMEELQQYIFDISL